MRRRSDPRGSGFDLRAGPGTPARRTEESLPPIDSLTFDRDRVGGTDMLHAETVMTAAGGAGRQAWHDVEDATAAPAKARFA